MTKRTLIINSLCLVFLALGAALLIYPIIKAARPSWPKINDPNQLIAECSKLMPSNEEISKIDWTVYVKITKSDWPESVKALNPRYVSVHENYMNITISTGGINPGWGFLIYPDKRTEAVARSERITEIEHPGIFRYETIE